MPPCVSTTTLWPWNAVTRAELVVARENLLPHAALEIGVARRHRVGADLLARQVIGQALRVVDDRGLEGPVGAGGKVDLATRHATDGDDRRLCALLEVGHRRLDQAHRAQEVDVDRSLPVLLRVRDGERTHIAHDDVDAAEVGRGGYAEPAPVGGLGTVAGPVIGTVLVLLFSLVPPMLISRLWPTLKVKVTRAAPARSRRSPSGAWPAPPCR